MPRENADEEMSDRRHFSARELSLLIAFLMNFAGIVWGAAIVSKTVNDLKDATNDLTTTTKDMARDITQIKIDYLSRINVLETRVDNNEHSINELQQKVR